MHQDEASTNYTVGRLFILAGVAAAVIDYFDGGVSVPWLCPVMAVAGLLTMPGWGKIYSSLVPSSAKAFHSEL